MRQMLLELNASDDRGIDVVREQIKTFASMYHAHPGLHEVKLTNWQGTKQIFSSVPKAGDTPSLGSYKLIVLDEADAMTSTAQMALRRIMDKYTANTRFCIIANYTHKLSPAVLSRCTRFRFSPLKEPDIRQLVDLVIEKEGVKIQPDAVDSLVRLSKGDMRRALNVLQACHASSKIPNSLIAHYFSPAHIHPPGLPLPIKNQPPPKNPHRETTTNETIYACIAAPHPADILHIRDTLLETPDITSCLNTIRILKANKGLALADILTSLSEELMKLEVPPQTRVAWMQGLADVENRLSGGGSEAVQTGGLVGVVRGGCDLMEHGGTR